MHAVQAQEAESPREKDPCPHASQLARALQGAVPERVRPAPAARFVPQLGARRPRPRPRPDRVRRAQRRGQDQPRRGGRLPGDDGQPPGLRRRTAGAARRRRRRWCGRRCAGATASCWSRSRSTRAGPTGSGSTAARCRGRASCSAWCGRCSSRPRTSPSCAATRPSGGASSTSCWSPARRGWPASAADYDRVLKQRNALLKTAGWPAARRSRPSTSGTATSPTLGGQLLAARLQLIADLAPHVAGVLRRRRRGGRGGRRARLLVDRAAGRRRQRRSRPGRRCRPPPS